MKKERARMTRPARAVFVVVLLLLSTIGLSTASAQGAVPASARFELQLLAKPYNFQVEPYSYIAAQNSYEVVLTNVGGARSAGPVTVKFNLPTGVKSESTGSPGWECNEGSEVTCLHSEDLRQEQEPLYINLGVTSEAAPTLITEVEVSGGGAPTVKRSFTNGVSTAKPPYSFLNFEATSRDVAGNPEILAAGHPNLFTTSLAMPVYNTYQTEGGFEGRNGVKTTKDIVINLPPGFIGNPTAAEQCSILTFFAQRPHSSECPAGSEVGAFTLVGSGGAYPGTDGHLDDRNPIYNLTPEPGFPAEFGLWDQGLGHGIVIQAHLAHTSQGYVVQVVAPSLVKAVFGPYFLQTSFFGNPKKLAGLAGGGEAFLTNPSDCSSGSSQTSIYADPWKEPAAVPLDANGSPDFSVTDLDGPPWISSASAFPAVQGCEALQFSPSLSLKPDTSGGEAPSGLAVDISLPQNEDPNSQSTPPLRDATVTLPPGLVVDPSVADGLQSCSLEQLAPDSTHPGSCPEASKLGTATVRTPLLDHSITGQVYLGTPECSPCGDADAAAGRLVKLYIELNDPSTGTVVKLPGAATTDPTTGQLTASFQNNPQIPFEDLQLQFKSGARAPLTTPATCGPHTTTTDLAPWSAPATEDAHPTSTFTTSSSCAASASAQPNQPTFSAGSASPIAGSYSPFVLKLSRENGSQAIKSLDLTLPPGLTGKLAGIPYCSDAQIEAARSRSGAAEKAGPSCPAASEVGTVNVGVGSGNPYYVQGHAYLAGPYKGAPVSLAIITPALAGPFDLGTVVVRAALDIDPSSAQITVKSDPIPTILAGVPLDIRSLAVNISRSQFALNPTSCAVAAVNATVYGTSTNATVSNHFQVGGCPALPFKPKLGLKVTGGTTRDKNPALTVVATAKPGEANIETASVALPRSEFLDQGHIKTICTRVQFASGSMLGENCPAKSIYGHATAVTPLLDKTLSGNVYLRSSNNKLPDLVIALRGPATQPVQIVLDGRIDSIRGGIRNTLEMVPDAPISKFTLQMEGGKKGLLVNSTNLCKAPNRATVLLDGQNGKTFDTEPIVGNSCKKKGKHHRKGGKHPGKKGHGKAHPRSIGGVLPKLF